MSFDAFQSAPSTPAPAQSATPKVETPAPTPKVDTPAPTPAHPAHTPQESAPFTPNFKFKVMDKEHEIPEMLRAVIKDAESEKLVKELHEKAYGLDVVKPRLKEFQGKYQEANTELTSYKNGVNELRELYSRGDFDNFFNRLQIPQEKVLQWLLDKAQYNEMPPEQRQVLDAQRAAEERAFLLEKQNQQLMSGYEESIAQARGVALQVALEKPDTKSIIDAYDGKVGKPGAFRDAVIDMGELAWYQSGGKVDLTPEQAIEKVIALTGLNAQSQSAPPIIPANPGMNHQAAPIQKRATMPNVTAGRQSAAVSMAKPKSLDDLKKMRIEKFGS